MIANTATWANERGAWEFAVRAALHGAAFGVVVALSLPAWDILSKGLPFLSADFVTSVPADAGRSGGISSILVSTAVVLLISILVAVPFAFASALTIRELQRCGHALQRVCVMSLDVLSGVPSVVFGLFGYALFCKFLGLGYSLLAGGLTLGCMIVPLLARSFLSVFEAQGESMHIAGAALGIGSLAVYRSIVIPASIAAFAECLVFAIARALSETAALIFTSGYADRMPSSVLDSGRTVSVHIYEMAMNVSGGKEAVFASASLVFIFLLVLSCVSVWLSRRIK